MNNNDFTATFLVDKTPEEAFNAINNVRGWWTENLEGGSQKLNDEFTVRFGDVHMSKQKLVELTPGKKVVWLVTDSKLTFVEEQEEWINTTISFDIAKQGDQTQVTFTHHGLTPDVQCYNGCSRGWTYYFSGSLHNFIATGKGQAEPKEA